MPAVSQAQRAYLNATKGHAWVKRHGFGNAGKLPAHVKGKKMAHKHGHHTGKIPHEGLPMHAAHKGLGKDKHASAEYHANNAEHGMHEGMTPKHTRDQGCEEGGEGMAGNCEYEGE